MFFFTYKTSNPIDLSYTVTLTPDLATHNDASSFLSSRSSVYYKNQQTKSVRQTNPTKLPKLQTSQEKKTKIKNKK